MSQRKVTLSTGTTIEIDPDDGRVWLGNPGAPAGLRRVEWGRVVGPGFQSPGLEFGLRPEALRALADLIDGGQA